MSSEYLSNDFPAPVEVCKCGRYASIDCMIAVSNGYKCISCVEKELHNQESPKLIDELSIAIGMLDEGEIIQNCTEFVNIIRYLCTKYRKGGVPVNKP